MTEPVPTDENGRLRRLVGSYGRVVESVLLSIERDEATREELWSDVISIAFHHLDELERLEPAQVRAWFSRTTRNVTANSARRSLTRRRLVDRLAREPLQLPVSAEDEFLEAEPSPDHEQRWARVSAAWNQLNESNRDILTMDALGLKGPSIADQLGITHQAARSRLMRARQAFLDAHRTVCPSDEQGANPV